MLSFFKNIKSTKGNTEPKLKVGIIGAGGKIGTEILRTILHHTEIFANVDKIIALNTRPRINYGMFLDFSAAYAEQFFNESSLGIQIELTNDPAKLLDIDLIFIAAGRWPSSELRNSMELQDHSGRLIQSYVNISLIKKLCSDINVYAPNAMVFVLTNQVDMMTEVARRELPSHTVIGIGGYIDSMRYKFILANLLFNHNLIDTNNPARLNAHIAGFHNNEMILIQDSLKIDGFAPDWSNPLLNNLIEEAIVLTRQYGKTVSELQSRSERTGVDTGSSIAPAKAVIDIMTSISKNIPLVGAFNIVLDEPASIHYGVISQHALSIPVTIHGKNIYPIYDFNVSESEKGHLFEAQQKMENDINSLLSLQQSSFPAEEKIEQQDFILNF